MNLTVGVLEEKLRKFPKKIEISVNCGCCHHGSIGEESILTIEDRTNQTYGYIELNLNASSQAEVKLSKDKEEFYKAEVVKLNKVIQEQAKKIERYVEYINSNISQANRALNGRF